MFQYLVRKVFHTLFVAVGVVTLVFVALRLSGDPAATMLPGDATVDEVAARARRGAGGRAGRAAPHARARSSAVRAVRGLPRQRRAGRLRRVVPSPAAGV